MNIKIENNIKDPNIQYIKILWTHIKQKCLNPKNKDYESYGGRGITIFPEWKDNSKKFIEDILKEINHRPTEKHSLDRINNNGNYEPGNLRWATQTEQNRNKSNNIIILYEGEYKTLSEIAKISNINRQTIVMRIMADCDEKKLFKPVKIKQKPKRIRPMFYILWCRIKAKCFNKNNKQYKNYGGRGITVFEPWIKNYKAFENYILSNCGKRPSLKHSLDRVNNDKGYHPGNLRWATAEEQARNRSNNVIFNINGKNKTVVELSEISKLNPSIIYLRIKNGWKEKDLLSPVKKIKFTQEETRLIREENKIISTAKLAEKYNAGIDTIRDIIRFRGAYKF